jgi:cytochrome c553
VIVGGGLGLLVFAWLGIYNVAASRGHFAITSWFLEIGMRSSVKTHSIGIAAPRLDDENMVRLGAGIYAGGCEMCHGAPGKAPNPLFQRMLPAPPDLSERVPTWENENLFWIVKHGIKYAGMPGWVSQQRDDEVWPVVAFLRKLPEMDPGTYRRTSQGNIGDGNIDPRALVVSGGSPTQLTACARCHDTEAAPPGSRLVPKLAGLTQEYVEQSLRHYASGARASGVMQPIASGLDEDEFGALAAYFAKLPPKSMANAPQASSDAIERGKLIAEQGSPASNVPACTSCHAGGALPTYPRLAGQHAPYVTGQLKLWQQGLRAETPEGAIMAQIARALSKAQIEDVAAYYESLPPERAEALR